CGEVIQPATAPAAPSEPKPLTSLLLAAILGAFVGLAGAILMERLHDPLGNRRAVEALIGGRHVLAELPRQRADAEFPAVRTPSSTMTNQLRVLHRTVAAERGGKVGVVLITSPRPGDGKSTVAGNLAAVMANTGLRVALIDADLHRPRLAELFGKAATPGLAEALTRAKPVDFQPVNDHLFLLAAGKATDPTGLLGDAGLVRLLAALRNEFDAVLIDAPPVQPLADAIVLASLVDAVLLVADPAQTTSAGLRDALDALDRVHAHVAGIVLNGVAGSGGGMVSYGDPAR
ncbi:MAG: P-loop NTPase, partial [Ilumatobacteraceae bacterium]